MKQIFALLLALLMTVSMAACGEKGESGPNVEANAGAISGEQESDKSLFGKTEEVWMVVSETHTSSSGSESTIEYAYNPDGSYSMNSSRDGYFEYDANGNEVLFKLYTTVRVKTYDENGNMLTEELDDNGSGWKQEFKYDDQGNCIEKTFSTTDGDITKITYESKKTYEYDSNGNITREEHIKEDFTYAAEYIYDEYNNCTCKREYEYDELVKEHFYDYTYDENGNMLTKKYPRYGGYHILTFAYNEQGLLISEKKGTELSDDCDKNIVYEYDENGNLIYMKSMNDIDLIKIEKYYQYDENGNLIYEKWTEENSYLEDHRHIVQEWVYTYDEHGNKIQMDYTSSSSSERTVWEYELISFSR